MSQVYSRDVIPSKPSLRFWQAPSFRKADTTPAFFVTVFSFSAVEFAKEREFRRSDKVDCMKKFTDKWDFPKTSCEMHHKLEE